MDDEFSKAVAARADVLRKADAIAPAAMREARNLVKMSDLEVMKYALSNARPAPRLDGPDAAVPAIFDAYYDLAVNGRLDSHRRPRLGSGDAADDARRRMIEESRNAWRR